jgi:hypothetical protein
MRLIANVFNVRGQSYGCSEIACERQERQCKPCTVVCTDLTAIGAMFRDRCIHV